MVVIDCQNLQKKYKGMAALNGITFQLEDHKITGLIGRNGAGKTTLLKILAGFIRENSGEVRVFSNKPFNNLRVSANSILVDDQMSFPDSLTLADILEAAPSFYKRWDAGLAASLFDYFRLNPKQLHFKLSKGAKATFNMIFGLATRCELTMFDEPTNGMDEAVRSDFYRALLKEYIAYPRSILISSHHLAEMEHLLEDILLIHKGKVVLHQSLEEVKEYAVALQGQTDIVEKLTAEKDVLHIKQLDSHRKYAVIKKEDSLGVEGVTIQTVSATDVCMFMTSERKGGIDDVFK
ncbi:ATP-binding cassette domain-containing protein [Psychrobacillus vulpis]|uniref:ABC transporter ATP-binding protein n=1 Tax=Psychrobacillus vulpis TaxID=2325572 RepID=A0A544TVJ2_9BACI|nr:ABC transporter ATP-binding protein [Psychrobacillus vulpis]TQR21446.1 ABC transporter ATP-binding protein [Psychrobacillus vulpis]